MIDPLIGGEVDLDNSTGSITFAQLPYIHQVPFAQLPAADIARLPAPYRRLVAGEAEPYPNGTEEWANAERAHLYMVAAQFGVVEEIDEV